MENISENILGRKMHRCSINRLDVYARDEGWKKLVPLEALGTPMGLFLVRKSSLNVFFTAKNVPRRILCSIRQGVIDLSKKRSKRQMPMRMLDRMKIPYEYEEYDVMKFSDGN